LAMAFSRFLASTSASACSRDASSTASAQPRSAAQRSAC
jgi:hypothetical protein